jgi:hypothetical protein
VQGSTRKDEIISLARLLFEHIEGQIKSADSKAWLTVSANGLLINFFFNLIKDNEEFLRLGTSFTSVLSFLFFASSFLSVFFALAVVKPSLKRPKTSNLFYFGDIADIPQESFIQEFRDQSLDKISYSLLRQVHIKSQIVNRKFATLNKSLFLFFIALILGVATQVVYLNR